MVNQDEIRALMATYDDARACPARLAQMRAEGELNEFGMMFTVYSDDGTEEGARVSLGLDDMAAGGIWMLARLDADGSMDPEQLAREIASGVAELSHKRPAPVISRKC